MEYGKKGAGLDQELMYGIMFTVIWGGKLEDTFKAVTVEQLLLSFWV